MRKTTFSTFAVALLAVSGCGSGGSFANKPRPATPVNLTVYINNSMVSVSPASVGAGEVVFIVTNQATRAESLTIHPANDSSQSLARTGPINPQSTDQVAVDLSHPGNYTVATSSAGGGSDAALAAQRSIQSASLHVGPARARSNNQLLQP
jgi:hypothetical protein